ncbi:hypothetical protein BGZ51_001265 [Haplosporangium sp. Z 767]|nr:hypothetical protein BGZ51_001265 [Haplosporangium sp. Z 767]KAF9194811.1 hypothetical protein BGZ50_005691 [Haplosporangium sp. Z 11]
MHASFQRFQFGDEVELIAVRQDATGKYYSQMDDIQDAFPNASRFKVNGIAILFLQDERKNRIAHYPDNIIQVIAAYGTSSSSHSSTPHHPDSSSSFNSSQVTLHPLPALSSALATSSSVITDQLTQPAALALSTDSQSTQTLHMMRTLTEAKEKEEEMLQ